jgi:Ca2+-transporting ATPase
MPVSKLDKPSKEGAILAERRNIAYQGTLVVRGEGRGIVVATGEETELGKISVKLGEQKKEETPLQKKIKKLSKFISYFVVVAFLIILIDGIWLDPAHITEIFILAVAVAVSAIPEGLIVSVTVILAVGARGLAKKKAYLRKLSAAETLGGVTVILTDKTGTLTQGRMTVDNVFYKDSNENKDRFYKTLIFSNSARIENPQDNLVDWHYVGSPTEKALLKRVVSDVGPKNYFNREKFILDSIPFDSLNKFQARLTKGTSNNFLYLVGAPEKALEKCSYLKEKHGVKKITPKIYQELKKDYCDLANQGLRVLGVAYKKTPLSQQSLEGVKIKGLTFLGFVTLKDPLRKNVKKALDLTKKAGIKTVIVTGDHALTAKAVAADLGFDVKKRKIIAGEEISKLSEIELRKRLKKTIIFARVSPYDKIRILQAYQKEGEVVAMTGDGINDALALKGADIGIALGSGQEVAREAADLVLLNDNFKNIVAAVRYGRIIFENIKKVIVYLLADSFTEILLVGGAIVLGMPIPLLPAQILWVNLIEDSLPAFAMALEPGEKGVMRRKPRRPKSPLLDKEMKFIIFVIGLLSDIILFGVYWHLIKEGLSIEYVRTIVFAGLTINSFFIILAIKSLRNSIFKTNLFNNPYLTFSILFGVGTLILSIYWSFLQQTLKLVALSPKDWLVVLGIGMIELISIEFAKWLFHRKEWARQ